VIDGASSARVAMNRASRIALHGVAQVPYTPPRPDEVLREAVATVAPHVVPIVEERIRAGVSAILRRVRR
jgi:hypothetical protein